MKYKCPAVTIFTLQMIPIIFRKDPNLVLPQKCSHFQIIMNP